MSLRARQRRLEAQFEWFDIWGELRLLELKWKIREAKRHLSERLAQTPKLAAMFPEDVLPEHRPAPLSPARPPPEPPPVAAKPPPPPPALPPPRPPPVMMSARDVRPVPPPPFVYDPPEHMRYRPVRWVPPAERTYDHGDDGERGDFCTTDYDVLHRDEGGS